MEDEKKKRLYSPAEMLKLEREPVKRVDDFQKTIVKDFPVDRINTLEKAPVVKPDGMYDKLAKFRALRALGKKVAGVIPFAGAGYAALQGDSAMAADELAGDVPFLGQAYEAIKPAESGNPEEERQMLAEIQAQKNYNASPAHLARLQALQKIGR